jgi:subtilisin family serine protease
MEKYQHLKLPLFEGDFNRKKRPGGGGGLNLPEGRSKFQFSHDACEQAENISKEFLATKNKLAGKIDPTFIFEINVTQGISTDEFEKILFSMGIHVLSVAEGKKGYWVVFSDDEDLNRFKQKLAIYGSEEGAKYDFFHAIESFGDIPVTKKLGEGLIKNPLGDKGDFVDIELWKIDDPQRNQKFINQLKENYRDFSQFKITDTLITKSFVLLRVKLNKSVLDEIIQFKEVARADRPATIQFNPFEIIKPDIENILFNAPAENATGILIIDSGIVASHPMLEKCVGNEENFQTGELALQDTVGHGTAVAGCAVYGDVESSLNDNNFTPSNWLFSAKVMYAEKNFNGSIQAIYDPEKLVEHQFQEAVESFLSNSDYQIKVVNISLGNHDEIWHKHYFRQLPFAALIDELAFTFPSVVFIVSAGNQSPLNFYDSISDIVDNYPSYLAGEDFKIINPATAALALTVGSIAGDVRIEIERYGEEHIKTAIAQAHQPSPFTRTGFGINGMVKPELVEYGGNLVLSEQYGRIKDDTGGKIAVLNNSVMNNMMKFDVGTSFAAPKVAHLAGKIANHFPEKSANFIKNMLLASADYPFKPTKEFYKTNDNGKAAQHHLSIYGYGLSQYDKALYSFNNRTVLWDEGQIGLDQIKVYSLQLPELFFAESGKKKIIVTLTFLPETRATRGDSYLGNHMEFHLFHSIHPQILIEKYGVVSKTDNTDVPKELKKFEIDDFSPGANARKVGCHQKAVKVYTKARPAAPLSLVLINFNKWITNSNLKQDYCISVTFEHEKEIELYNAVQANIQNRVRVR